MYPYIRCFCSRSLGDKYELFKVMRLERYRDYFERTGIRVSPNNIPLADNVRVEVGDILDQLGLTVTCCRTRMITQVEYEDEYSR